MSFQVGIGSLDGTMFFQVGLCTHLQTMISSGWGIERLLKGSQCILHDTPAWREEHSNITGSKKYSHSFVSTRRVEDKVVAERFDILK